MLPAKCCKLSNLVGGAGLFRYYHQLVPLLNLDVVRVRYEVALVCGELGHVLTHSTRLSGLFGAAGSLRRDRVPVPKLLACLLRTIIVQDILEDAIVRAFVVLEELLHLSLKLLTGYRFRKKGAEECVVGDGN